MKLEVGEPVTFGVRISASDGPVTIAGSPTWNALGLTLIEEIVFVTPGENNGQEPGITTQRATEQFARTHPGDALTIEPGEDWFFVMTVSAPKAGSYRVGAVTIPYGSDGDRRSVVAPTGMTLEVSR